MEEDDENEEPKATTNLKSGDEFRNQAAAAYALYAGKYKRRFRWLSPHFFNEELAKDLETDAAILCKLLLRFGEWQSDRDAKLDALEKILVEEHPKGKVLVFSQFADTVHYLESRLQARGVTELAAVTGDSANLTELAWRFSPKSNGKENRITPDDELRILIATDVLSEGQNLQDCAVVVNYDLPWAIIRLIQRVGRVDRIGQKAGNILCCSFLPAEGVDRLLRLRERVRNRLHQNAEVVGTDEAFFEDEDQQKVLDLYNEKAGILDNDAETDVDLSSYAYQIWRNATEKDSSLRKTIEDMPPVVYTSKAYEQNPEQPGGVLVYIKTAQGNDVLTWVDRNGNSVTESQFDVLHAAECAPDTPAMPRLLVHHELVSQAMTYVAQEEKQVGGQLGRPTGARYRTYERLKQHAERVKDTLFDTESLHRAIEEIYRYPLRQAAVDALNRQLRSGVSDEALAELVVTLREEDRLCVVHNEDEPQELRIICSMGLVEKDGN